MPSNYKFQIGSTVKYVRDKERSDDGVPVRYHNQRMQITRRSYTPDEGGLYEIAFANERTTWLAYAHNLQALPVPESEEDSL